MQMLRCFVLVTAVIAIRISAEPGPQCNSMINKYRKYNKHPSVVSFKLQPRNVTIHWGSNTAAHAKAALLAVVLKYRYGYEGIVMDPGPQTLCEMTERYKPNDPSIELAIHVAAEDDGKDCPSLCRDRQSTDAICSLVGNRFTINSVSPRTEILLHAHFANRSEIPELHKKGIEFTFNRSELSWPIELPILIPKNLNVSSTIFNVTGTDHTHKVSREVLNGKIDSSESFLFLDYDIWQDIDSVRVVQPRNPHTVLSYNIGDINIFHQFARKLSDVYHDFHVSSSDIRGILTHFPAQVMEELACDFILKNPDVENHWNKEYHPPCNQIVIFMCQDDEDIIEYKNAWNVTLNYINNNLSPHFKDLPTIEILGAKEFIVDCKTESSVAQRLEMITRHRYWFLTFGAVANAAGVASAAIEAGLIETQLVLYDVAPDHDHWNPAVSATGGTVRELALAARFFISRYSWKRIAIISTNETIAIQFSRALLENQIVHRILQHEEPINGQLNSLKAEDARVIVVNTGSKDAASILDEACELGMTSDAGYIWIVRDWKHPLRECRGIRHFTISYWWRGGDDSVLRGVEKPGGSTIREHLNSLWQDRAWPEKAAPLVDALLLLTHRIQAAYEDDPSTLDDLHSKGSAEFTASSFRRKQGNYTGVIQDLSLAGSARKTPLIYVQEWTHVKDKAPVILDIWKVEDEKVVQMRHVKNAFQGSPPSDGRTRCLVTSGDPYYPVCHDLAWALGLLAVLSVMLLLVLAVRIGKRKLARRDRDLRVIMMTRNKQAAAALSPYLVDRTRVTLQWELGAGHYGRVRAALLYLPNKSPLQVAAKEPVSNAGPAEEAEFLQEAFMLGKVQHRNIIQLKGICVDGGSTLLLLQYAVFGDLLNYVRSRAHLPLGSVESQYVTPAQLTRLAREAAAALAYLAANRLVHRDVRASNCLIDEQRALKLADFGMVRTTEQKKSFIETPYTEIEYNYQCQRRGFFPVPWMAPESVTEGVFSSATDVWSLGVLMLEIATMGARPYGSWKPARVLAHVREGGVPAMPLDVSRHTREALEMCWHRTPEHRASAMEIHDYFLRQPTALEQALISNASRTSSDHDSGLGDKEELSYEQRWLLEDARVSTV